MAHSKSTREKARQLYVHSRYAIAHIAITLDVSTATISRWKSKAQASGDDWDIARSAATMSAEGRGGLVSRIIEDFTILFQSTLEQLRDDNKLSTADRAKIIAGLADSFNKVMNAAGRAAPELSRLSIATEVLQAMAQFIADEFPQHGDAFVEILEPFGQQLARDFSG